MNIREVSLLGIAVLISQQIEFALYGIALHLDSEKLTSNKNIKNKFNGQTAAGFLHGDKKEYTQTLGRIYEYCGKDLGLKSDDFDNFISNRNDIIHNYLDLTRRKEIKNGEEFLEDFIKQSKNLNDILNGVLKVTMRVIAKKHNREDELSFSKKDELDIEKYITFLNSGPSV